MFQISWANFLETLPVMLFGMLGIFIVMVAIFGVIFLFGRFGGESAE